MNVFRRPQLIILSSVICFICCGWGGTGHKMISSNASRCLPAEMNDFKQWSQYLTAHASDADYRKGADNNEAPRHFIDIDNYSDFLSSGRIDTSMDALVKKYGLGFVMDQGVLPWAILDTYDSLKSNMSSRNWDRAKFFAADLGHYVADSFMPLHITANYDGQKSGQKGIHSRYESKMIDAYQSGISIGDSSAFRLENTTEKTFNMIYENYRYTDSLLASDKKASSLAGGTSSDAYYKKLWEYTRGFTGKLFTGASVTLASFIYTAWIEAGRPAYSSATSAEAGEETIRSFSLGQNYPNPFNPSTVISYSVPQECRVVIRLFDITGRLRAVLLDATVKEGRHSLNVSMNDHPDISSGVYLYSMTAGAYTASMKMLYLK